MADKVRKEVSHEATSKNCVKRRYFNNDDGESEPSKYHIIRFSWTKSKFMLNSTQVEVGIDVGVETNFVFYNMNSLADVLKTFQSFPFGEINSTSKYILLYDKKIILCGNILNHKTNVQ